MVMFRRLVHATLTLVLAAVALPLTAPLLEGQVVRGVVRAGSTLLPIDLAVISALDKSGAVLGRTESDQLGGYELTVRHDLAFDLQVRRLGYRVSTAAVKALQVGDTADFEFLLTEVAAVADAVVVTGEPGLNDRRLAEAHRRGWRVYDPELVMRHRDRAGDFIQLLQSMGNPGLILPRTINDCVRTTRMNRCLTYVVDNQVLGTWASVQPSDVYFFAIVSASEARVQFGDRAPFGAIVIYTRSRLDRVQPPRSPTRAERKRPAPRAP